MDAHNDVKLYKGNEKNEKEAREVSAFLENSYHFKEMKRIASKQGMQGAVNVVADIEKHLTFYNILYLTRDIDPKETDNIVVYNLGRNKTNVMLYTMGFFSNNANFTYHALHLRECVQAFIKQRGPQENNLDEMLSQIKIQL